MMIDDDDDDDDGVDDGDDEHFAAVKSFNEDHHNNNGISYELEQCCKLKSKVSDDQASRQNHVKEHHCRKCIWF